jgi:uncharacterized membrane protein YbjE (DUF340 family)
VLITYIFLVLFPMVILMGRLLGSRRIGYSRIMPPVVSALVFSMSAWAASITGGSSLLNLVLVSITYALVTSLMSLAFSSMIPALRRNNADSTTGPVGSPSFPLVLVASLIGGWLFGEYLGSVLAGFIDNLVTSLLVILIVVVGLDVGSSSNLRLMLRSIDGVFAALSCILGSAVGGLLLYPLIGSVNVSLAIALGMGWYSLDGPFLALRADPTLGMVGFLANFLREQLTFYMVPLFSMLGFRGRALIAMGGATAMDDTLPIYTMYLGRESAVPSFVSGFLITLAIPFILDSLL